VGQFIDAIVGGLASVIKFFATIGGGNTAIGIILFTIAIRLLLLPLTLKSVRSSRAMQQLQPNIAAFYHDVSQIAPSLQNDPYIMLTGNGQIHNVIGQGYPLKIVIPTEGAMATPAVFDIIKGTRAKSLLEQLLNAYLDPANQLEIAKAQYWAVPNTKVVIPDEYKNDIPSTVITLDPRKIAAHQQEWATRAKRQYES